MLPWGAGVAADYEGEMPVAAARQEADGKSRHDYRQVRDTRLQAHLSHTVTAGERVGQQSGREWYENAGGNAEQTAYHDQLSHRSGEHIPYSAGREQRQRRNDIVNLMFAAREPSRQKQTRYDQQIGQHRQQLLLERACAGKNLRKRAEHRRYRQPGQIDHERQRQYSHKGEQQHRRFSRYDFHDSETFNIY